jgi:hypothetical protein
MAVLADVLTHDVTDLEATELAAIGGESLRQPPVAEPTGPARRCPCRR